MVFGYLSCQEEEEAREEARQAKALARAEARTAAAATEAARNNGGHKSPTQFSNRSYEMWAGEHGSEEQLKDIKSECGDSFVGSHGRLNNGFGRTRKVHKCSC